MTSKTWGERGWDDETPSNQQSDYVNMKENGSYSFRVCGKAHSFATHWLEAPRLGKTKVNCAGEGCVLCKTGQKASVRYLLPVLVRAENSRVALVEVGPQVFDGIKTLFKNPKWGNPMQYDISIDKNANKKSGPVYMVLPDGGKEEFTAAEKASVKSFFERMNLVEKTTPIGNAAIMEKLGQDWCEALGLDTRSDDKPTKDAVTDDDNFSMFDGD